MQHYHLQYSLGGDERTKFYISGSFLDEESIFIGNEYLKLSTRTNLEHKITVDNLILCDDNSFGQ